MYMAAVRTNFGLSLNASVMHRQFDTKRVGFMAVGGIRNMATTGSGHPQPYSNPYANARALTDEEIKIIQSTVPVLAEHGVTLTTKFYQRMLSAHPELKNVFNQAHQATGMQPQALAKAVHAYASNITNLGALGPAVRHIAHRHASLSILPSQYPIVGENLLITLRELLTSAKFPEETIKKIVDAWAVAYAQLSSIFIAVEEALYEAAESTPGGWRGWRKFIVKKRNEETSGITSFTLAPADGGAVPPHLPGQFTTVRAILPQDGAKDTYVQPRQYSLSEPANNKTFRITVKREDPIPTSSYKGAGVVSTWVHTVLKEGTEVELAPPFGDFVLKPGDSPVVLLGAGVGITPLTTMMEAANKAKRPVSLLYAARSGAYHPLKDWFVKQKQSNPVRVWYSEKNPGDKLGTTHDEEGFVDLSKLPSEQAAKLLPRDADVYICGPLPFMHAQLASLRKLGFKEEQLHAELFGAGGV